MYVDVEQKKMNWWRWGVREEREADDIVTCGWWEEGGESKVGGKVQQVVY